MNPNVVTPTAAHQAEFLDLSASKVSLLIEVNYSIFHYFDALLCYEIIIKGHMFEEILDKNISKKYWTCRPREKKMSRKIRFAMEKNCVKINFIIFFNKEYANEP